MSILLGGTGPSVIVGEMQIEKRCTEVLLELRTIVGEDEGEGKRKDRLTESKEVRCCF